MNLLDFASFGWGTLQSGSGNALERALACLVGAESNMKQMSQKKTPDHTLDVQLPILEKTLAWMFCC